MTRDYSELPSTINLYSLLLYELFVLLIKFIMGATIHVSRRNSHFFVFGEY